MDRLSGIESILHKSVMATKIPSFFVAFENFLLNAAGGIVELRIGDSKGILIGESKKLEPSEKMDFNPFFVL